MERSFMSLLDSRLYISPSAFQFWDEMLPHISVEDGRLVVDHEKCGRNPHFKSFVLPSSSVSPRPIYPTFSNNRCGLLVTRWICIFWQLYRIPRHLTAAALFAIENLLYMDANHGNHAANQHHYYALLILAFLLLVSLTLAFRFAPFITHIHIHIMSFQSSVRLSSIFLLITFTSVSSSVPPSISVLKAKG